MSRERGRQGGWEEGGVSRERGREGGWEEGGSVGEIADG